LRRLAIAAPQLRTVRQYAAACFLTSNFSTRNVIHTEALYKNAAFAMRTRTATRLAAEEAAARETASAREVLLSEDLFGELWPSGRGIE
jgi:hypothetical protein